jgi:hypothetical protein
MQKYSTSPNVGRETGGLDWSKHRVSFYHSHRDPTARSRNQSSRAVAMKQRPDVPHLRPSAVKNPLRSSVSLSDLCG